MRYILAPSAFITLKNVSTSKNINEFIFWLIIIYFSANGNEFENQCLELFEDDPASFRKKDKLMKGLQTNKLKEKNMSWKLND